MTEHDLLEVVEIEEASGLSRWGWEAYHAELLRGQGVLMYVARQVGEPLPGREKIAGFIASRLIADELHINNVAVRHSLRRRGIGGQLLGLVIAEAARMGARKAFLEVRAGNTAAQSLYEHYGFSVAGRRPNYYLGPVEDALVMSLSIRS
jgi:ribosomal-protein-alanine N-acetyltransferase